MISGTFSTRREWLWALASLCLLGAVIFGGTTVDDQTSTFCQSCGLLRWERRQTWCGLPLQREVRYRENEFYRLYTKLVAPQCRHQWRFYHGSSGSLLGPREFGCGRRPFVLAGESPLRYLANLGDRARAAAVLASFDLGADPLRQAERELEILDALWGLESVSTRAEEERWWRQYRHLFRRRWMPAMLDQEPTTAEPGRPVSATPPGWG